MAAKRPATAAFTSAVAVSAVLLLVAVPLRSARVFSLQEPSAAPLELGVVVVSEIPIGEESSGSVVQGIHDFDDVPALQAIPLTLPNLSGAPAGGASVLDTLMADTGDGKPQPANTPLLWAPGRRIQDSPLKLFFRDQPDGASLVTSVPAARAGSTAGRAGAAATVITAPLIATAGSIQAIYGAPSGDGTGMSLSVDGAPAAIVASRRGAAYWRVPKTLGPGAHQVLFTPARGQRPVRLPMSIVALKMSADRVDLLRGQSTRMHVTVSGLETIQPAQWQFAMPAADLVDLSRVQQRVPSLKIPRTTDPGVVLVIVENRSPAIIRMGRGASVVMQLHQRDVSGGQISYDDKLQSLQAGGFDIRGTVIAFVGPATASPAE